MTSVDASEAVPGTARQILGEAPAHAAGPQAGDFWVLLRRHRLLVGACVLAALALGTAYLLLARKVYEATAVLAFESDELNLPTLTQVRSTENRIGTAVELLQGAGAARAAVDSLGLRATVIRPRSIQTSEVLSLIQVAPGADTMTLIVRVGATGGRSVARAGTAGQGVPFGDDDTVRIGGVALALTAVGRSTPELTISVVSAAQAIRDLRSNLSVARPSRDADLITIGVKNHDSLRAPAIANLLANQLIASHRALAMGRSDANIRFLHGQLDSLGAQLRVAEDTLRAYRERTGVVDAAEAARTQVNRLAQIEADRGALVAERDALGRLLHQLDSTRAGTHGDSTRVRTLMSFPTLLKNQAAAELLGALASVENERAQLLVRRTSDDPDVQVLTARIGQLNAQLEGVAKTYLQGVEDQVDALGRVARGFGSSLDSLPAEELEVARRERAVKVDQDLYTLIQTRLKEAEVTGSMDDQSTHLADPAVTPDRPVQPRPVLDLGLAFVVGIIGGIGVAIGRDLSDRTVRSRADAASITGLPVVGAMPRVDPRLTRVRVRTRVARSGTPALLVGETGSSSQVSAAGSLGRDGARLRSLLVTRSGLPYSFCESIGQLYTNLVLSYREDDLKVLAVTSPSPGDGKTLTSVNLALTAAMRGQRVLLVDADLRRGLVSTVFALPRRPGLAELLSGAEPESKCVRSIATEGACELAVLPSGQLGGPPGANISVERVTELLTRWRQQYDLVVIDCPPANLVGDAALFASCADGVLLMARAGVTTSDRLAYAVERLAAAHAPVIGVALNEIDLRRHGADDAAYQYLAEAERYYQPGPDR